ncbi:MAG: hypothetical protein Q7R39_11825 [Dehalococcoidia bacterium]|nr:hypothetical protein [Dehalococcoidia bacterium]
MARFTTGRLVWTRGVNEKIAGDAGFSKFILESLRRHARGDWGDLSDEDRQANDLALKDGSRLLSAYEQPGLPKVWVITEADRSATTVLFPDEY